MPTREGKRRDLGLRVELGSVASTADASSGKAPPARPVQAKPRSKASFSCNSQFCTGAILLLVCILLTVWGDIVDIVTYSHKAHMEDVLREFDVESSPGGGSRSAPSMQVSALKGEARHVVRHLPNNSAQSLVQNLDDELTKSVADITKSDLGVLVDESAAPSSLVPETGSAEWSAMKPSRGTSQYCECKSECYASTEGSWCYLKDSSCKLLQPCAKAEASDFCIAFGPGGPSTRCINIFSADAVGQRTPVRHFELSSLSDGVVPRAKAVAAKSEGNREHAIVQKVYLEQAMAEELGHGILEKRNNLFMKTSRGKQRIIPELNASDAHSAGAGAAQHRNQDEGIRPKAAKQVVRGQDGKLHVIDRPSDNDNRVASQASGQSNVVSFHGHLRHAGTAPGAASARDGSHDGAVNSNEAMDTFYSAQFPWLQDLGLQDGQSGGGEQDPQGGVYATDPDDEEGWNRLWLSTPTSDHENRMPSSSNNYDGIYKSGSLPSLPCHLMLGETKPCNLLFIMADQHRHDYVGAPFAGSSTVTPVLDHFRDLGAHFQQAITYVPVCVPSRASLLTGVSAEANKITSGADLEVSLSYNTFIQALSAQGYVTGYYGKWHNSNQDLAQFNMTAWGRKFSQQSFDPIVEESQVYRRWLAKKRPAPPPDEGELLHRKAGWGWPYVPLLEFDDSVLQHKAKGKTFKALPQWAIFGVQEIPGEFSMSQYTALQTAKAIHDVTQSTPEVPFAMAVSFQKPHPPMLVGHDFWFDSDVATAEIPSNWQDKSLKFPYTKHTKVDPVSTFFQSNGEHVKTLVALYKAAVREVDAAIGVLINALKQIGIEHNTLIVYASDHGSMLGNHGLMGKSTLYEEAVRVPLLFKLPHVIPADTKVQHPVTLLDVAPTILDYLLGSTAMKKFRTHGQSLRPLVERKMANSWQRYATVALKDGRWYMVRTKKWKLVWDALVEEASGLYNLAADPYEMHNYISLEADSSGADEDGDDDFDDGDNDDSFSDDSRRGRRRLKSGRRVLDPECTFCYSMLQRLRAYLRRWRQFAMT